MPTQSKELATDNDTDKREEEQRLKALVKVLGPAAAMTVFGGTMTLGARQSLQARLIKNPSELAQFTARLASVGAFFEFILNPILGKLGDSFGRRPIAPLGGLITAIIRAIVFLKPDSKWALVLDGVIIPPFVTSFFTTGRAALADHLQGSAYAKANAIIGMPIGLAIVLAPLVAKVIMNRAHPKYCFLASVAVSLCTSASLALRLEETLPKEKRKPMILNDMQPLSFLQLMRSRVLNRLMLVTGMQTFSEGRNISEFYIQHLLNDRHWNWSQINNFLSVMGMSLIFSGVMVEPCMKKLGLRMFTTMSNACNTVAFLCSSVPPPAVAFTIMGFILSIPGGRKRDAVESLIMKHGNEAGFGNGFISGSMMNFRAIINIFGPILFGSLYAQGRKKGFAGIMFVGAAATILMAEGIMRSLKNEELGLDENGRLKKKETAEMISTEDSSAETKEVAELGTEEVKTQEPSVDAVPQTSDTPPPVKADGSADAKAKQIAAPPRRSSWGSLGHIPERYEKKAS